MSTALKVRGGTRSASLPRLCDTCHSGVVLRGDACSAEEIHCQLTERPVLTRVVECSRYSSKDQPSLWDMRRSAWILETDSKRQRIGFVRTSEWERKHEGEELLPTHLN
jgi:hypothetical protein